MFLCIPRLSLSIHRVTLYTHRVTLCTVIFAMPFVECSNFQSSIDGRQMDVNYDVRSMCIFPECVHFVQLYAEIPHRYPNTLY